MEWLDYTQASEKLNIPESTIRRYGKQFEKFIEFKEYNRKRRLSPDSVALLARINDMLANEYTVVEVREVLTLERSGAVKVEEKETETVRGYDNNELKAIHALIVRERETNTVQAEQIKQMAQTMEQLRRDNTMIAEELKRIREQMERNSKPWYKRLFK